MIILGVPVVDQHELTARFLKSLSESVADPTQFAVVIIDNNSEKPYTRDEFPETLFDIGLAKNHSNRGFYYPLIQLYNAFKSDYMGLCHNDIIFYEHGWDQRIKTAFEADKLLSLIGFCGSNEVDELGGRGSGTMCNFRGVNGFQLQEMTGKKITDPHPALVLDSLFMMFRRAAIPDLEIDEHIVPCHFYDKIWPMKLIERGHRVAVLGVEIDHVGGQTSTGERYAKSCEEWCQKEHINSEGNAGMAVYKEAERRWLSEFRDKKHLFPSKIGGDYAITTRPHSL